MNVYDFDGTIFYSDCSIGFALKKGLMMVERSRILRNGGIFFNIKVENSKKDMLRAVLEGICYHLRWLLECED